MPKMKTHRGAAKRFIVTKSGRIKRSQTNKRHLLNGKTTKRKRSLRKGVYMVEAGEKNMRELLPYS